MKAQRTPIGKFINATWTNINLRSGKYRRNTNKNKCYRNIIIEMSREEFKNWCLNNKNLILSLKKPSIDRIDNTRNYSINNIQVIELSDNCKKKRPGSAYLNGPKSNLKRGIKKTRSNRFIARITVKGIENYLGIFNTEEEAYIRFKKEYIKIYGKEPWS